MPHIILRVKQDSWDASPRGNCPVRSTLPLFFADEPVLVLGKTVVSNQQQLIVLKLDSRRPYPMFVSTRDIETSDDIHFTTTENIDTIDIYATESSSLEHISLLMRGSDKWTRDEEKALYDYCRDKINACLETVPAQKVNFVPSIAATMDRFPDAAMSQQLQNYESYPLLNPSADNYIIDCRYVPTRRSLVDYLRPSLSLSESRLFEDMLGSAAYLVKHEGKILSSPQMHLYFTNAEYLFCDENDTTQAIHKLLDSLHRCAELWPNDLRFFSGGNEQARFKSVFYYIEKSKGIEVINQVLTDQNERTLQPVYFYG